MTGRARLLSLAAMAVWSAAVGSLPAGAQVVAVSGGAFAVSVTSSVTGVVVAPTPGGVAAVAGGGGFAPVRGSFEAAQLTGVLRAASLRAATDGSAAGAVTSEAALDGLSVAAGLLAAGATSSTCMARAGAGSSGSSRIEGLTLAGTPLPVAIAPNTSVDVPGVLRAVLNEQVVDDRPESASITVRAAHVVLLPTASQPLLDVVVAESRCRVAGAGVLPLPDDGRPSPVPTTAPPVTGVTPSTSARVPTTVRATTTSTPAGPGGTPAPVPGPLPAPAGRGSGDGVASPPGALRVSTPDGKAAGPPGVELRVVATGYEGCSTVQVRFGATRIGVAHADADGNVAGTGLSVPGDAAAGRHPVSTSCRAAGRLVEQSTSFEVVDEGAHRSAFVTSLAEPDQVDMGARSLFTSAVVALGMLIAIAFPSELFNSTLEENYAEVRGWFGLPPVRDAGGPGVAGAAGGHQGLLFAAFVLFGGLLYGLLSPDLGLNASSVALVLGLALSLVVISVGFRLPQFVYVRRTGLEWARLKVLPGTAIVAAACVLLSRLVHFQPGYLYGLIAGLAFRCELDRDTSGRLTAISAVSIFLVSLLAWFARAPVAAAAARPGASLWVIGLEATLAAICILGIETIVICLIPMRFVEGSKLTAWSRTAWAVVFGLGAFAFVHILLRPSSGYVGTHASRWVVVALFLAFGLVSIGFWAYFRFRPARQPVPA